MLAEDISVVKSTISRSRSAVRGDINESYVTRAISWQNPIIPISSFVNRIRWNIREITEIDRKAAQLGRSFPIIVDAEIETTRWSSFDTCLSRAATHYAGDVLNSLDRFQEGFAAAGKISALDLAGMLQLPFGIADLTEA